MCVSSVMPPRELAGDHRAEPFEPHRLAALGGGICTEVEDEVSQPGQVVIGDRVQPNLSMRGVEHERGEIDIHSPIVCSIAVRFYGRLGERSGDPFTEEATRQRSPCRVTMSIASVRFAAPTFRYAARSWLLTVFWLT